VAADDVLDVLARADASSSLPRLGGMARASGVVIATDRFWAYAGADGSVSEGVMPGRAGRFRSIPLLRGLVRLGSSLAPLARGHGVASGRERIFLLVAVVAPLLLFLLPEGLRLPAGLAVSAGLVFWMLRGRTLRLHGAEHRAIAAVEERRLVETWAGSARPTRFAARCGTNFAALALPVTLAAERLWPLPAVAVLTPVFVALFSLALTMELWVLVQASERRAARALLMPGLALQRLTTREPELDDTRLALVAAASVLRRELAS
jgi:uncharacterized protein YqhQ